MSSSAVSPFFVPETVPKARILVVDDEPDNLDLLYRTFRREFDVLRAESGQAALDVLAECGEVAVIISDQRMPEMKGTEFLSKTVPDFPDTVRIILTGFTDVEDLVDAINAGQVYRYITKPWEPDELKRVVKQAVNTYGSLKQRGDAILLSRQQHTLVSVMAEIAQTNSSLHSALSEIAKAIHEVTASRGCIVHLVVDGQLGEMVGTAGDVSLEWLKKEPLVAAAIADKALKCGPLEGHEQPCTSMALPEANAPGKYYLMPVIFREAVVAVIVIQLAAARMPSEAMTKMIQLAAKQTSLILACL